MSHLHGKLVTRRTSDGIVVAAPCVLHQVLVYTATAAATTGILYDNASAASGTVVWEGGVPSTAGAGYAILFDLVSDGMGVYCTNGLYLDGTFGAAGHSITVYYQT